MRRRKMVFVGAICSMLAVLCLVAYHNSSKTIDLPYTEEELYTITLAKHYKSMVEAVEKDIVSADTLCNINGETYTLGELEKIWVDNPWLEELEWNKMELLPGEQEDTYYVEIKK